MELFLKGYLYIKWYCNDNIIEKKYKLRRGLKSVTIQDSLISRLYSYLLFLQCLYSSTFILFYFLTQALDNTSVMNIPGVGNFENTGKRSLNLFFFFKLDHG